MIRHKEQRVGVFVDVANMYHSAKNVFNARVNFQEILNEAVAGRKLVRANAYVVKSPSQEEQSFLEALTKQGFDLKIKDLQIYPSGAKKADWDVGLSIDAVKLADKVDAVVIVSGDGDYIPLLTYLRENKGCTVEVMAFGETTNSKLREEADDFIDLSKDKHRFLMSMSAAKRAASARASMASMNRNAGLARNSRANAHNSIDRAVAAVEKAGATKAPEVLNTVKPAMQATPRTTTRSTTTRKAPTRTTATRSTAARSSTTASAKRSGVRSTIKRALKK